MLSSACCGLTGQDVCPWLNIITNWEVKSGCHVAQNQGHLRLQGDHSLESFHRLFPFFCSPSPSLFLPTHSLVTLLDHFHAAFLFSPSFTNTESATSMAEQTPSPGPTPNGAVKESVQRTPMKRLAPVPSRHFLDWLLKYQIRGSPLPIDLRKLQLTCGTFKSSHRR